MTEKRRKLQDGKARRAAAGAANLAKWKREHAGEANLRHGVFSALCSGTVPDEVRCKLDAFQTSLENDLGGVSSMSATEHALIASCRVSYSVVLLAQVLIERSGVSQKRAKGLAGVLSVLGHHQASLSRSLKALGIEKRTARPEMTIDDIAREYHAKGSTNVS